MSDLKFNRENSNLGGIAEFKFIFERQLVQDIEIIKGQVVSMISTAPFIIPDLTFNSSSFKETPKGINLFEYEFKGVVAQDDLDKLYDSIRTDTNKIIAIVKDNNNQSRLLGQNGNACLMELSFDKGKDVADLNKIELNLVWKSKERAAFANNVYIIPAMYQFEDGEFYNFND
ncbi:MAG: hypothetical protein P1P88_23725 [Bacteroidales bacterium]|nr:hypothetical protein [Bacteroidales bacterium]